MTVPSKAKRPRTMRLMFAVLPSELLRYCARSTISK